MHLKRIANQFIINSNASVFISSCTKGDVLYSFNDDNSISKGNYGIRMIKVIGTRYCSSDLEVTSQYLSTSICFDVSKKEISHAV